MSTLEIVLYSLLGAGFVIYLIITIIDFKKGKFKKKNRKTEEDQDNE